MRFLMLWCVLLAVPAWSDVGIEVEGLPDGARHESPVPYVELRGYAWTGESPYLDVAIAIDLSRSTLLASGSDVDGDGYVGRLLLEGRRFFSPFYHLEPYDPRALSTDRHDSVAHAELRAARAFVDAADWGRTRVALVSFSRKAKVEAGLGTEREAFLAELERLTRLERRRRREFGGAGTNMGMAMLTAGSLLLEADSAGQPRRREVILLSDGMPDLPDSIRRGARFAAAAATVLTERGVGVNLVPIGLVALVNEPYFEFLDEITGETHTKVLRSGELVERLPELGLHDLAELSVRNRSTDQPGRALRLFADGSFDAVVPLQPGTNEIAIRAVSRDGDTEETVRALHWPANEPRDEAERAARDRALEAFAERLRARTVETGVWKRVERAQDEASQSERTLTLEAEESGGGAEAPGDPP